MSSILIFIKILFGYLKNNMTKFFIHPFYYKYCFLQEVIWKHKSNNAETMSGI